MTDNDVPYWPHGFFAELDEIADTDKLDTQRLDAMYERAAEEATTPLLENPSRALMQERGQLAGFEARLKARWGPGLDLFELTVVQARETGQWINAEYRPAAASRQDQQFEALIRLHGRGILTAQEVLVLLRSGFSTGAFARWRTLHEIWVVFALLSEGDEELARRYLAHDAVESIKGQREYEETWQALGFDPPDWTSQQRDELGSSLRQKYGASFLEGYGWAVSLFGGRAPTFQQLQELAKLDHWRGYYRMASHGTHANPKGIRWNIQAGADTRAIWAGPSNAGLLDPAQCVLIALANVTVELLQYAVKELITDDDDAIGHQAEALINQQPVLVLMNRAIQALAEIHKEQERQEKGLGELINRITEVLQDEPMLTARQIAERLGVDLDELEKALTAARERGRLKSETRYRPR